MSDEGKFQVAVGAVIRNQATHKVLLIHRAAAQYGGGIWEIPTGRVRQFETVADALHREVAEETGITDLTIDQPLSVFDFMRGRHAASNEVRGFVFATTTNQNAVVLSKEHDDYQWLAIDDAIEIVGRPGIKHDLEIFRNIYTQNQRAQRLLMRLEGENTLDHERYLSLAMREAEAAAARDDVPVGAVLVDAVGGVLALDSNRIHSKSGYMHHAGMQALLEQQKYLFEHKASVTLYSTLEPSTMLMGAAVLNHIKRIVWAADDYWAGGSRSLDLKSRYLQSFNIEFVSAPIPRLEQESIALLYDYFSRRDPGKVFNVLSGAN